ncbi:hemolysin family protein [Sphaerobacter sp.]|uniref:hemolysin family protein n=1 Tax=Sphaerobacter sp. TaxID=2099654 RepID=UPI001E118930|nr:hemolysin family protein [Sphaerobacter sp.]MBX5446554.1 HlyC/CorC family transporter [Sphaerobacter sp.]
MVGVEVAIILVLLGINAVLAASEIAIVSARKTRLRALADDGNEAAAQVLALNENPSAFLATIQVGITLAGFFSSAVGAVSLVEVLGAWLADSGVPFIQSNAEGLALVVVTGAISFVSIIFGELVPKTLAVRRADTLALIVVRPVQWLATVMRPFVVLLTATTNLILRLFRVESRASLPGLTADELLAMLETAEDEGLVEAEEADLIEEAFQFGRTTARSVMVPRVDVVALEASTTLGEAVDRFFTTGFSRIPVYQESLDAIVGILYVKDVFRILWSDPDAAARPCGEVVRPAYFVPDAKPIDELLRELRARRTHMAICVDEFGGTAGLVTLEDLIEELVGEITDEFDPGYEPFREVSPGVLEVDGRASVGDLLDRLELEPEVIGPVEAESVGGLITDRLGRIPVQGDSVVTGPLRLTVLTMTGHRPGRVRVAFQAEPEGDGR